MLEQTKLPWQGFKVISLCIEDPAVPRDYKPHLYHDIYTIYIYIYDKTTWIHNVGHQTIQRQPGGASWKR